jgi:iron complex transport system ATP-binding protein
MERKADELLERLEIASLAGRNAEEMSSGEARRMVIARALVHAPRALVLDEPTNSLDFQAMHSLRATLSRIARDGTGLILVTHHLDDIVPEVTRVILLNHGRVVADGTKADMLTPTRLSTLYGVPVELEERYGLYHLW